MRDNGETQLSTIKESIQLIEENGYLGFGLTFDATQGQNK